MQKGSPKMEVVTIGGGGGHAQILKSLKKIDNLRITGICPSTDSGGSTGVLREEYGAKGYLGDLTKCVAALSPDDTVSKAMMYRYDKGPLAGHSVKNLLLLALENTAGDKKGLETLWRICGLDEHRVLPVTEERTQLYANLTMGKEIASETNIDTLAKNPLWHPGLHAIESIFLKPAVSASNDVTDAILSAETVIICPGDLYSSILPTLIPKGMKSSLKKTKAKIIMVLNIANKKGETDSYTADDFISLVEKYAGRAVDVILHNNKPIPESVTAKYQLEDKIMFNPDSKTSDSRVVFAPFGRVDESGFLIHDIEELTVCFNKLLN